MPRLGLDTAAVVGAAAEIADTQGVDAVTLARVADRLGVRAPSLYVHIAGLAQLRGLLAARGARELAGAVRTAVAGQSRRDALAAAAGAYRRYAHDHPGCYAVMQRAPVGEGEDVEAAAELYGVIRATLSGYHLHGAAEVHGIRAVRAGLHGFVSLEQVGGLRMRVSTDASYGCLVEMLHLGLSALGAGSG
jgi:AcrR family transcriptional regulator